MLVSDSQMDFSVIQSLPRYLATRFSRQKIINDHDNLLYKITDVDLNVQPPEIPIDEENKSSILLTGIRDCDWNFHDDIRNRNDENVSDIQYRIIPSINNTIRNRSINFNIDFHGNHYEEYDLDEQDFQWLIGYNEYRIIKQLPELDENIFEYLIQLFEHQCFVSIRQKNFEDTVKCDICHRIDDVSDFIQCVQCKIVVHQKCYGVNGISNEWICDSCSNNDEKHICILCNKSDGALKAIEISIDQQRWVHLSCAFWFPKFRFNDQMIPLIDDDLSESSCERCSICDQLIGIKINCSWKDCLKKFHARCAIDSDLDMLVTENDEKNSVGLLTLCYEHTEKIHSSEKQSQMNKYFQDKQNRYEAFSSYINLDLIKQQTSIVPDIVESVYTYWVLKRQANNCRPLIDIPDEIFNYEFNKTIDLTQFARQYHSKHDGSNLFVLYAQRKRVQFTGYQRNFVCLIDIDKKKRDTTFECLTLTKDSSF